MKYFKHFLHDSNSSKRGVIISVGIFLFAIVFLFMWLDQARDTSSIEMIKNWQVEQAYIIYPQKL